MNKLRTLSISGLFILMVCSCNPVTHISVTVPKSYENNKIEPITVNSGVEQTWNRIISNAMDSPFKIKKIDSTSHIVSLTVSGKPSLYIDCGTKKIDTDGNVHQVVNADSQYTYSVYRDNHLDTYSFNNHFKGKAIIFVSGNAWTSTIQVKIDLELISNQQISTTQGSLHGSSKRSNLNLTGSERKLFDGFRATCQSTGKFEKEVRALLTSG